MRQRGNAAFTLGPRVASGGFSGNLRLRLESLSALLQTPHFSSRALFLEIMPSENRLDCVSGSTVVGTMLCKLLPLYQIYYNLFVFKIPVTY